MFEELDILEISTFLVAATLRVTKLLMICLFNSREAIAEAIIGLLLVFL